MKVLHVGEYVNGGVATYLKTLLNGLKEYPDIENYMVMSEYKSKKDWDDLAKKVIYYKYKRGIFNIFKAMWEINRVIEQINPDVVHVHSSWAGLFVRFPLLFKKKNFELIYQPHGWAFLMDVSKIKQKIYLLIEKLLSIPTDKIINISNYEQNQAIVHGLNKNKMVMIYNGVKDRKNTNNEIKISMDRNKINLLFVGRLDRQKGLDIFLNTYNKYKFNNIHLYVIGTSVLNNEKPNNTEKTTYLGWVDNQDIDAYYQACDAVIMPSRWEGFGLVAVEAMKNSKAVIASDRGALPELIEDNVNGFVVSLTKEKAMKSILEKLDKNILYKLGDTGHQLYLKKYTDKIFVEKIYNNYVE